MKDIRGKITVMEKWSSIIHNICKYMYRMAIYC